MSAQPAGFERPQPRTRPANRRQLVTLAARELFFERGYDSVSMSDIAEAVAMGPSALYRHFKGKQELLHEVLVDSMVPITHRLGELAGPPEAWIPEFVAVATEHDKAALLWQREQVHLSESQRNEVRDSVRTVGRLVAALIGQSRPELDDAEADFLAWAALAVALSPAFYTSRYADDFGPDVIADLVAAVVSGPHRCVVPARQRPHPEGCFPSLAARPCCRRRSACSAPPATARSASRTSEPPSALPAPASTTTSLPRQTSSSPPSTAAGPTS